MIEYRLCASQLQLGQIRTYGNGLFILKAAFSDQAIFFFGNPPYLNSSAPRLLRLPLPAPAAANQPINHYFNIFDLINSPMCPHYAHHYDLSHYSLRWSKGVHLHVHNWKTSTSPAPPPPSTHSLLSLRWDSDIYIKISFMDIVASYTTPALNARSHCHKQVRAVASFGCF